jgi:hypothetical protein
MLLTKPLCYYLTLYTGVGEVAAGMGGGVPRASACREQASCKRCRSRPKPTTTTTADKAKVLLRRVYFLLIVESLLAGCGLLSKTRRYMMTVHQLEIGLF